MDWKLVDPFSKLLAYTQINSQALGITNITSSEHVHEEDEFCDSGENQSQFLIQKYNQKQLNLSPFLDILFVVIQVVLRDYLVGFTVYLWVFISHSLKTF